MPLNIMIVEDHDLTRQGLVYGFNKTEEFKVVSEAIDGKEAIDVFKNTNPEVVLMDIALPVKNGIELTKIFKEINPDVKIVMLTSYNDKYKVFEAFEAGAVAYCLKDIKFARLLQIIQLVAEGGIWLDSMISDNLISMISFISKQTEFIYPDGPKDNFAANIELTLREQQILKLITEGLNNKDIAEKLSLSVYTVKNHVSNIISKLAVSDRTQAAILALKEGLI